MKVAFSNFVMGRGKTGIATYVKALLNKFQKRNTGINFDILTCKSDVKYIEVAKNPSFHWKIFPDLLSQPILNILWHNTALPFIAKKQDYDLIHIPSIRRIPLIKTCKIIATVHDVAPLVMDNKYDPMRMFYHKHILTKAIHHCDKIITVSQETRHHIHELTRYPQENIKVIYPGIDHVTFHPIEKELAKENIKKKYFIDTPFFVYVSRIEHPAKNHINLIKAFEHFKKNNPSDLQCVFAGSDWNGAEVVRNYAQQSRFQSDIHFLGFVPTEDIVSLYNASSFMIFPSFIEGFGFPLLEAMACGTKVLCSDIPIFKEISGDFVEYFDPHSPIQICKTIENALANTNPMSNIEKAITHTHRFNWEKTAEKTIECYTQISS